MFILGSLPGVLVALLYRRLHEPSRWTNTRKLHITSSLGSLFSPEYRRRTFLNCCYEIGGQPVSELGLDRVSRMFEEPHSYTLTLRRGQTVLHLTVKLRKLM